MRNERKQYLFICTGPDCKKNGCKKILKSFSEQLKKEKKQSSVRIIKTKCMDHCKKGPNVVINNQLFHKVSSDSLERLLQ